MNDRFQLTRIEDTAAGFIVEFNDDDGAHQVKFPTRDNATDPDQQVFALKSVRSLYEVIDEKTETQSLGETDRVAEEVRTPGETGPAAIESAEAAIEDSAASSSESAGNENL